MPVLTNRLLIRGPCEADIPALREALAKSRPELERWMSWATPWPDTGRIDDFLAQSVRDFADGARHVRFECFIRESGKFVVSLGCTDQGPDLFHISYWARSAETGKGYTTEAVAGLVRYLFTEAGAKRIDSGFEDGNIASQRVLEKCGFRYVRDVDNAIKPGVVRHEKLYARTQDDLIG